MSRIGRLPVVLDKSVQAVVAGRILKIEGPKGKLEMSSSPDSASR